MSTARQYSEEDIQLVAEACHEANRTFCESLGDDSQPEWAAAPDWQKESAVAGVRGIAEGRITRPEGSHESWLKQKLEDGWVYGPVKNPKKKEHPCCVPYDQLAPEQQEKDAIFFRTATELLAVVGGDAADTPDIAPSATSGEVEEGAATVVGAIEEPPVVEDTKGPEVPEPTSDHEFLVQKLGVGGAIEIEAREFRVKTGGANTRFGHGKTIEQALGDLLSTGAPAA